MSTASTFAKASAIGLAMVAPFVLLELRHNPAQLALPVFVALWMLPTAFVMTLTPLVQAINSNETALQLPFTVLLRISALVLLAAMWLAIVRDQMPCFMGVPNCD